MQFNTLIAPLSIQEFIAQYWNKNHFHLNRKEESFYQKLISKEAIDQVLFNNQNLAFGAFKFYRGKEEASSQHYSQSKLQNNRSVTVLDPKKVTQLFAQGYSCYINQPDQFFSNLNLFLGQLEA